MMLIYDKTARHFGVMRYILIHGMLVDVRQFFQIYLRFCNGTKFLTSVDLRDGSEDSDIMRSHRGLIGFLEDYQFIIRMGNGHHRATAKMQKLFYLTNKLIEKEKYYECDIYNDKSLSFYIKLSKVLDKDF